MHLGHARTFWTAQERTRQRGGTLILRNEDLDRARCQPAFVTAMFEDLKWFGFEWQEGPDCGGPFGPYDQSERGEFYRSLLNQLIGLGRVYPCTCSRKDIQAAVRAPHASDDDEPIYPGTCRSRTLAEAGRSQFAWRFRVTDGETVRFDDEHFGPQEFVAGRDFGDFVVWRPDGIASYQLAVVADDATMKVTEVVRGADLLKSTARQILLQRALGLAPVGYFHCALMTDNQGQRLAKRHDSLSLRELRLAGRNPAELRASW